MFCTILIIDTCQVLFEVAILRMWTECGTQANYRAVYLAPVKALCSEKHRDWCQKFSCVGLKVVMLTGDSTGDDLSKIQSSNIIITTPEKWDAVSRKLKDPTTIASIRLVMIDEVHLLNDDSRGHVLEAVLCRMKTLRYVARYVAVSATFPNIKDVAFWLGGNTARFFKVREVIAQKVVIH